ncbi:hypothetical protein N7474_009580 [Penicillium riverlandense]|uniref:uncharacterized protein n=1 Tax=Penicillium riverlandense TaxID=1903569 RepID=UPI002546B9E4|nr:uncharacterized protein N7474_009580 [Penicillium riverlandense]KAJ5808311.1 hypothetical protein N7474_009580 [Penicillium riverlandense]
MPPNPPSSSLYGKPRSKSSTQANQPSSSNLSFTTQLSSLISQGTSDSTSRGRPRPSKTAKADLFSKPNKGSQKRAAADLEDESSGQVHQRSQDIGSADAAALGRSKRRMEEKVRMYEDMKKGMYLAADSSDDEEGANKEDYAARLRRKEREGLVDFDKKWADEERKREDGSDDVDEPEDDDNASIISYEDELGRSRRGTRAEAARAAREKEQDSGQGGADKERWRPSRPDNLIYGETVQSEAFNPDAGVTSHMAHLATRRDRSPTPPENMHYDADAEVRNRGTGFYAFSRDEEERKKQMEELLSARGETQRERDARQARRAVREAAKDERRAKIQELRNKRLAERFLAGLQPGTEVVQTE